MALCSLVANPQLFGEKPSFVPVVSVQWSQWLATAFSVDTVVTARHSVTFLSPSCPPPSYPFTAHPPQFAPWVRSAGIVIWNWRVFSNYTLLSIFFSLPPKILQSLTVSNSWSSGNYWVSCNKNIIYILLLSTYFLKNYINNGSHASIWINMKHFSNNG